MGGTLRGRISIVNRRRLAFPLWSLHYYSEVFRIFNSIDLCRRDGHSQGVPLGYGEISLLEATPVVEAVLFLRFGIFNDLRRRDGHPPGVSYGFGGIST